MEICKDHIKEERLFINKELTGFISLLIMRGRIHKKRAQDVSKCDQRRVAQANHHGLT